MRIQHLLEGTEPQLPGAPEGIQIMTPQQFVAKAGDMPGEESEEGVAEGDDIGYHQTSGTKAGHTISSRKLSNKPQASKSDVTLQSGSMHQSGKSYNFPKGTLFTQLPGGIFAKHPSVPETHTGYGHLIRRSEDNIHAIHSALNGQQGVAEGAGESVSFREMVNVVDEHYPKYYAELSGSDISDKQFEQKIINAYKKIMQKQGVAEDWQKANKRDRTDGMSQKAVNAYRRENPGSKLKTAVTTKPSKLKKGGKASKRRKSYCSRSRGQMKMHSISCAKTPDKAICKARRRWNC